MKARPFLPGEAAIVADIRERIAAPGASKHVAYQLGLSRAHLLSIANGNKRVGEKVARRLGYQPAWERILIEEADADDIRLARKIEAELARPSKLKEMG